MYKITERSVLVYGTLNIKMKKEEEMFYLTTHSTQFILWLYGIGHMVKDHSNNERENPLLPLHGLHFRIDSKGSFIFMLIQLWSTGWSEK